MKPYSYANETNRPISESDHRKRAFGSLVFDLEKMRDAIPEDAFQQVLHVIRKGDRLDANTANIVATAMKNWAEDNGCTHYTHWFQPMTGTTAEKHDSFLDTSEGKYINSFTGKQLTQGEPDASSFPSGGIRSTFEARGYTIWDPTSPAFILETESGKTMCVPGVFVSYTGETLDKKAPLLRSNDSLNNAALEILRLFKNPAEQAIATLGVEQEYFLIDGHFFEIRPDIAQSGRTLFGVVPSRHQQMEDQYFGSIAERAFAFMNEVETEARKVGIPLKTRHNEVAPNQFEFAQLFEEANLAVDHNQMLMTIMQKVARKQGLTALFQEKPFAGVNGSGKHCNWSLATDKGENLLNPGNTPHENLQFLVFLVSVVKAVHDHPGELRAAVASAGNDLRLGANEAPPAILSVFLGDLLTRILSDLEQGRTSETAENEWISVGIDRIPEIPRDNTDRNRTSPFAFTSNKFEFRAVGGSHSPATAITVLNTAVAGALMEAKVRIEGHMAEGKDFAGSVVETLRSMYADSKNVCFEGDNYSDEWIQEAARRGLPNIPEAPNAYAAIVSEKSVNLFSRFHVYNQRELEARYHINMENYIKQIEIEAAVMIRMTRTRYIPGILDHMKNLAETLRATADVGEFSSSQHMIRTEATLVSEGLSRIYERAHDVEELMHNLHVGDDIAAAGRKAIELRTSCDALRDAVDSLEWRVARALWPVKSYSEMLRRL